MEKSRAPVSCPHAIPSDLVEALPEAHRRPHMGSQEVAGLLSSDLNCTAPGRRGPPSATCSSALALSPSGGLGPGGAIRASPRPP